MLSVVFTNYKLYLCLSSGFFFQHSWHVWLVLELNWWLGWRHLPQQRICIVFFQNNFKTSTMNSPGVSNLVRTSSFCICPHPHCVGFWTHSLSWEHFLFYSLPYVNTRFCYHDPLTLWGGKNKNLKFSDQSVCYGKSSFLFHLYPGTPFLPQDWFADFLQMSVTI